jgi:secreted trypsin-like serine protease
VVCACGGGGSGPAAPSPPGPGPSQSSAACGAIGTSPIPATAIINGTACSTANSSVLLVTTRDAGGQALGRCSGTVVAPRAVVTAAHCVDEAEVAQVELFLGTGFPVTAEAFRIHPGYRANDSSFDVAVVLLREDIGRAPIPVLTSRDPRTGESAAVAGWGRDAADVGTTLRAGLTTISAVSGAVINTQFSSSASAVCQGDSGGALLVSEGGTWTIAGVISANSTQACVTGTNFYANLRHSATAGFVSGLVPGLATR